MPRFFNLAQAQGYLPRVRELIQQAVQSKSDYERSSGKIQAIRGRIAILGGVLVDRLDFEQTSRLKDTSVEKLKSAVEEINELGVLVKDLDVGLIDFPTLLRGEEVYLCWRLGEDGIQFWHGVHEGFAGRKEIDDDFLQHHEGRPPD